MNAYYTLYIFLTLINNNSKNTSKNKCLVNKLYIFHKECTHGNR